MTNDEVSRSEKVTWLLPVKNGMPYLSETLASIEAQTYHNYEILAWDNGSTDGTIEELYSWIPGRLPGRVISDNPLSLGSSLAHLVEAAQTELCARIDADDLNYPERLERQVAFMREHPRVGIVGTQVEFIDEEGKLGPDLWTQPHTDAEIRWQLRWQCPFNHPTVMLRRSVVLAAGNYADCIPEDYDLWMRLGFITECENLPEVLLKYRRLSTSFTAKLVEATGQTSASWMFDSVAQRYSNALFAGISGDAALKLRRKVVQGSSERVQLADLYTLAKVASATARAAGKPGSYFRVTETYRRQKREIISRWIRQRAWGRSVLTAKRRISLQKSSTTHDTDPV
jgi:glycosyltransferase involved in cell wall biosynthesis